MTTRSDELGQAPSTGFPAVNAFAPAEGVITAEIPAVRPRTAVPGLAGLPAHDDPGYWVPGDRRLPAPVVVRVVVWLLVLVLVVCLAGLAVEHWHPTWLAFARRTEPSAISPPTSTAPSTPAASTSTVAATAIAETSSGPKGAVYSLPSGPYSVAIYTTGPCWSTIVSPASSKTYLLEMTLQASAKPKVTTVDGTSSVEVFSGAATKIVITSGSARPLTIEPTKIGYTYTLDPSNG